VPGRVLYQGSDKLHKTSCKHTLSVTSFRRQKLWELVSDLVCTDIQSVFRLKAMDSPKSLRADTPKAVTSFTTGDVNVASVQSGDELGRVQPWKKIMEGVADRHEANPENDLFTCSHGFYSQSVAA
jgi:hypothetical protein